MFIFFFEDKKGDANLFGIAEIDNFFFFVVNDCQLLSRRVESVRTT